MVACDSACRLSCGLGAEGCKGDAGTGTRDIAIDVCFPTTTDPLSQEAGSSEAKPAKADGEAAVVRDANATPELLPALLLGRFDAGDKLPARMPPSVAGSVAASGYAAACPICLEEWQEGDILVELPCGHEFHVACATSWAAHQPEGAEKCPMCTQPMFPTPLDSATAATDDPVTTDGE